VAAAAFCGAALILALLLGSFHQVGGFGVETDFYQSYAVQAQNILAGRPYTYPHHPPGYTILLGGVSLLTGDLFVAGKIISAFAIGLLGLTAYGLLKALFDPRIALASTILCLFALIPYSFLAATDVVGALLMLLPLRILLNRATVSLRFCLLTGICAGIAYLVRSNAVSVILGIGFCLLFIDLEHEGLVRRLVKFGFFVGGALLTVSPWFIINWKTNGSPFASTAHLQMAAHFYYPTGDAFETTLRQAALKFSSLSDVVLYDQTRFLRQFLTAVFYENIIHLAVQAVKFPAYLFAGPGLLLLLWDLSRKRLTFLLVCLIGYLLLGLVGFHLRLYLFLFPLLFTLVAYFFFHKSIIPALWSRAAQKNKSRYTRRERRRASRVQPQNSDRAWERGANIRILSSAVSWLCVIVLACFVGMSSYRATRRTLASEPRYLLEIASFLRNRSTTGELIIVRKSHLAYLAGLTRVFPLANTSQEFLAKAREIGARYIVYSEFEASLWPGLKSLRNASAMPGRFKLIYTHYPTRTLIYEIRP